MLKYQISHPFQVLLIVTNIVPFWSLFSLTESPAPYIILYISHGSEFISIRHTPEHVAHIVLNDVIFV